MEEVKQSDSKVVRRRLFARLNARIQNKYLEMQKKLDRAKSVDSIASLSDELVMNKDKRYSTISVKDADVISGNHEKHSTSDFKNSDEVILSNPLEKHVILVEDVCKSVAYESSNYDENSLFQAEIVGEEDFVAPLPFYASSESLNDEFEIKNEEKPAKLRKLSLREKWSRSRNKTKNESQKVDKMIKSSNYDENSLFEAEIINEEDFLAPLPFYYASSVSLNEEIESKIEEKPARLRKLSLREKWSRSRHNSKNESRKVDKMVLSNVATKRKKRKIATCTIVILKTMIVSKTQTDTPLPTDKKSRVIFCWLRLGSQHRKYKSKKTKNPTAMFRELYSIDMFDDDEQMLEISFWDKNTLLGKTHVDLSDVEKDRTHKMQLSLEEEETKVQIVVLLTVTGTTLVNTVSVEDSNETQDKTSQITDAPKQGIWLLGTHFPFVGILSVVVYGATGLSSSESYCIVELQNERLQTHTEVGTTAPTWNKKFEFTVKDVTSILEIVVMDDKKIEVIGDLMIFLLHITNGQKKWYPLKDYTLRSSAKGNHPAILLELNLTWSVIKAVNNVLSPKEDLTLNEPEAKFDRHTILKNWNRVRGAVDWAYRVFLIFKDCFQWKSKTWNTVAITLWIILWAFFSVWMIPLLLMAPFVWYRQPRFTFVKWIKSIDANKYDSHDRRDSEVDKSDDDKMTLIRKLMTAQEVIQKVQNALGEAASLSERIKNLFNFSVPFLTLLAMFLILCVCMLFIIFPPRYVLIAWGIRKYMKRVLYPDRVFNNEALCLLSRVPDNETLHDVEDKLAVQLSSEDLSDPDDDDDETYQQMGLHSTRK